MCHLICYHSHIHNLSEYHLVLLQHHKLHLLPWKVHKCQQGLKSLSSRVFSTCQISMCGSISARTPLKCMPLLMHPHWNQQFRSSLQASRWRHLLWRVGGMRTVTNSRSSWHRRNSRRRWRIVSYQRTGRWMHLHCSMASCKGHHHSWIMPQNCRRLVTPLALAEWVSQSVTQYSRIIFYSFPILSLPSTCVQSPSLTVPRPMLMASLPSCLQPGILWWLSVLSVPHCQQPLSIFLGLSKHLFRSLMQSAMPSNRLMDAFAAGALPLHLVGSSMFMWLPWGWGKWYPPCPCPSCIRKLGKFRFSNMTFTDLSQYYNTWITVYNLISATCKDYGNIINQVQYSFFNAKQM